MKVFKKNCSKDEGNGPFCILRQLHKQQGKHTKEKETIQRQKYLSLHEDVLLFLKILC